MNSNLTEDINDWKNKYINMKLEIEKMCGYEG